MVDIANSGPGAAAALQLRRRGLIDDAGLTRALRREGLEDEWLGPLRQLTQVLLSPAELANARQQGFISPDRQHAESAEHGIDAERSEVLFELAGLPPGAATAQEAANRGLVDRPTFDQMIREGHTKTKYTELLWSLRRAVLSPAEAASARLRTWITAEESYAIGANHGYSREQMDLLFLNRGRPASPAQMWRAWARKITGPRGVPTTFEDHAKAIAISDIRPEYAELLWGIRYQYPTLFQLGRLVQSGAINPATAAQWAEWNLYGPEVVTALTAYWQGIYAPGGATGAQLKRLTETELRAEYEGGFLTAAELSAALEKLGYTAAQATMLQHLGDAARVKAYRDKVLGALHKAYVEHSIDDAQATATMTQLPIGGEAQADLLRVWRLERDFARTALTAAQVKRAYRKGLLSRTDATIELEDRGYSASDAGIYLDS
jgi:hypothetical protein